MMILFASNHALFSAYFQADFFGKCIFFGLFALSILCWIVLIYKTHEVRKAKHQALAFERLFEKNKERLLHFPIKQQKHPFAQVFLALKQKTLEILNKNHFFAEEKEIVYLTRSDLELLESHVLTTISSEAKRLEKNLFILSTIEKLAPFLGLLGTVWGILVTFSHLQGGAGVSSNNEMLGGLSTALATTVLGLLIAIPALISHNWLRNSFKYIASDMEDFLYKLLSTLEFQYRKPL
ncbi:MAG: Biopolymer transport protein ExbB [Chlamydiae bacterium]|nr:Biopolymer transport protein ExbB [Chlamydiota bacterium]